jgi:glycine cleavage system transcriptional repressor
MAHYLLTAAGPDRPGLVADVSKLLFGAGCNLEDSSMTRLQGEFAMLVIFSAPPAAKSRALAAKFKALEKRGIRVTLKSLAARERKTPDSAGKTRLVTVYGGDQPGIVFHVTRALAGLDFNVTDLTTHRTEGDGAGYILYIEGEAPVSVTDEAIAAALEEETSGLGLTASVKPVESSPL